VNAEVAHPIERRGLRARAHARSARARIVGTLGPLVVVGGVAWAVVQPYRLTLLHPHGQGFWWLLSEPPLFVVVVGLVFWRVIAPGLLEDLEDEEAR
jgi:hypothetical protein